MKFNILEMHRVCYDNIKLLLFPRSLETVLFDFLLVSFRLIVLCSTCLEQWQHILYLILYC